MKPGCKQPYMGGRKQQMDKSSSRRSHTCMSVLSHLSFIQQILTESLLCATCCPERRLGYGRHLSQSPDSAPSLLPTFSLAVTTSRHWYHDSSVRGIGQEGRQKAPPTSCLFRNILTSSGRIQGKPDLTLHLPHIKVNLYPIPLAYGTQRPRKIIWMFQGCSDKSPRSVLIPYSFPICFSL